MAAKSRVQGLSPLQVSKIVVCMFALTSLGASSYTTGCGEVAKGKVCCGGRVYDYDYDHICCPLEGEAYPDGEAIYTLNCVNGSRDSPLELCGNTLYDSRFNDCCSATFVFERRLNKRCCVGYLGITVVNPGTVCCDGQALRPEELCCYVPYEYCVMQKAHNTDNECCTPEDDVDDDDASRKRPIQTFNTATHFCSRGGIVMPRRGLSAGISRGSSLSLSFALLIMFFPVFCGLAADLLVRV